MSDTQHIVLTLDTHRVPLNIERDQEPFYRKAQQMLNAEYNKYRMSIPSATTEQLWMYVALKVAYNLYASTRELDLEPYLKAINTLNREIENKLTNQK